MSVNLSWFFLFMQRGGCFVLGLASLLGCTPAEPDFTLYLQSQDLEAAHPLVVYLDTTAVVALTLVPNNLSDYYHTVGCLRRAGADSITVVVHDTLVVQRSLPAGQWSKAFIKVRPLGKQRDYNDPAVPRYMLEAGEKGPFNLIQVVDSLYDNGLLPEQVVQLPKDSLIHISFQ